MSSQAQQFVVNNSGKKTAVLVPIRKYEKMLEDLHDLAVVAERKEEKPVSFADMKRRTKETCP